MIIGGPRAPHAIGGPDLRKLADAHHLHLLSSTRTGPDLHLILRPREKRL
jgi:riboflavin biosynthesis pyrimidine reductase